MASKHLVYDNMVNWLAMLKKKFNHCGQVSLTRWMTLPQIKTHLINFNATVRQRNPKCFSLEGCGNELSHSFVSSFLSLVLKQLPVYS